MTAFAPLPEPGEIPPGMVHVGWRCISTSRHDCLVPLSAAQPSGFAPGEEVHLGDNNHHGHWVPVYVAADALEAVAP